MNQLSNRYLAIDVLRGMTIFFMIIVNTPGSWSYVYPPLLHAKWHGCTPTDLVFPFFLFIVGVSMAFSFVKYQQEDQSKWVMKVLKRTALIFIIGVLLNWFPFYNTAIGDLRILGVLQRIALAFGGAALLIIFLRDQVKLAIAAVVILLGYWLLMWWGGGNDPYSLEGNLATSFDVNVLGERHVYKGFGIPFDPEGLVSTISGIAHVLIGYFIGLNIQKQASKPNALLQSLGMTGIVLVILGQIWNFGFPINKPIWTSSYVLYTTGLATLFLAALIWIIDVKGWKKWTSFFRVFGLNPLIAYVLSGILAKILYTISWEGGNAYSSLYETIFRPVGGDYLGSFLFALNITFIVWLLVYPLFKKNILIKV